MLATKRVPMHMGVLLITALLSQLLNAQQKPPAKDAAAVSAEAKTSLQMAKSRLGTGWDYLVQNDVIVLFEFDVKHPDTKAKAQTNAKAAAVELLLLLARFRVDAPPPDAFPKTVPILRVFHDEAAEKAFLGAENTQKQQARQTEQLASNEVTGRHGEVAWQWYLQQYLCEGQMPERWFRLLCTLRYSKLHAEGKQLNYDAPDLSKKSAQIATASLDEVLTTMKSDDHLDSFVAALADLLERGPKLLGKDFDPAWEKIVPVYLTELRIRAKDQARKVAFAEVDATKLENAVREWATKKR
ncbi:MAG: hypothetical protein NT107_06275 [Planctomycetota bacterium]|nr:hypothetical protein [Planctomycetota bacterium]